MRHSLLRWPEDILREANKLVLLTLSKRRIQSPKGTYLETCMHNLVTEERERIRLSQIQHKKACSTFWSFEKSLRCLTSLEASAQKRLMRIDGFVRFFVLFFFRAFVFVDKN